MTQTSHAARSGPTAEISDGNDDSPEGPLIQVTLEEGEADTAVYAGAALTNRTPQAFAIDAVIAMAEICRWESLGYTIWARNDDGFAHPLSPAIRGLRPPG